MGLITSRRTLNLGQSKDERPDQNRLALIQQNAYLRHYVEASVVSNRPFSATSQHRSVDSSAGPSGACLGQWILDRQIGQGRWSRVYAARPRQCAPSRPADYAVKLASADSRRYRMCRHLLCREQLVASQITHPHVVPVLDASTDDEPAYLVMPRLIGATVRESLQTYGRLAPAHALWIARQAAEGLSALHGAGWLHGDIKPDNIMVADTGHATLFDFGFAIRLGSDECRGGEIMRATMSYAAPEIISPSDPVGPHADIYSLGIALYEMLTGRVPFTSSDADRLVRDHLETRLPNPRQVVPYLSRHIRRLLERMTAKQPLRRPTADELIWLIAEVEIDVFADRVA